MTERKTFTDPKGAIRKGAKLQTAVCGCGHKGKSQRPRFYQCLRCYYAAWAQSEREKASKLAIKADKLRSSAEEHQATSDAFRAKHGHDTRDQSCGAALDPDPNVKIADAARSLVAELDAELGLEWREELADGYACAAWVALIEALGVT